MEDTKEVKDLKEYKNKKQIIIAVLLSVVLIAIVICAFILVHFNSKVSKFKSCLEDNNISELHDIYVSTNDYKDKKEMSEMFEHKLNSILEDYILNNQDYDKTIEQINSYKEADILGSVLTTVQESLNKIKSSKDEFSKAKEYETNGDLLNAIISYTKVIEQDKINYEEAQNYINANKESIKNDTLAEVDELVNKGEYITAKEKLNTLLQICSDDNVKKKHDEITNKAKEQEIEKYKNEQEVTVESARIAVQHETYKSLYPDMLEVVIKNNSNKTIKDYQVVALGYDSNNYPLKIKAKYDFTGGDYEILGSVESANVVAGATFGNYKGIALAEGHGISKVIAIVKDATYYDGTKWENPYYKYWIEQYKEKPLV